MDLYSKTKDISSIVNLSLKTLRGVSSHKIAFNKTQINENLYAVIFDINKSSTINEKNLIEALNLLGERVLGVSSCMSDDDSKYIISGIEDEKGLELRTYLVVYVYEKYEKIKKTLAFMEELELLSLDVEMLLGISLGKGGNQIDSLKELANITKSLNITSISKEVDNIIESLDVDSLQYSQLQRFLDIACLIDENDAIKLTDFFSNLYKGEVYFPKKESVLLKQHEVIIDDALGSTLNGILSHQKDALDNIKADSDLQRIITILESLRKYFPNMPKDISSKKLLSAFINTQLELEEITIPITYEGNVATFISIIGKDEIIPFRDFLQEKSGEEIHMNFIDCKEINFAIIQLIMAYKKNYNVTYEFSEEKKLFQTVLEGFDSNNNSCTQ